MPEGDTIHRSATRLARALGGKTIARFESAVPELARARIAGLRVTQVEARGKHLAIRFDDGHVLLSHMRMTGAWHLYKEGERWWEPAHLARVVLGVGPERGDPALVAVCFAAPVVRFVREAEAARDLATLGPDVVADAFAHDQAVAGLRAAGGDRPIGVAIMDQTAVAGVGNIYKSETLFAQRVSPLARVSDLDDATLAGVVDRARALMRRNTAPAQPARTTTKGLAGARYAVYRRSGEPCPRCGALIARIVQGPLRRSTYYCPRCQPAPPLGEGR
ncbi:MAG TPA: DNA-formamidopyrimidine glycosylase family protein [Polyangiaceae bacterium]|jgi:endonuclease-8|nr:DNA-formamidopyrimidine glycosylase family protein [Polyangiaceae bacterium]